LKGKQVSKPSSTKKVKLETYGKRLRVPKPVKEIPEKVKNAGETVVRADWSWLLKDWRIWMLLIVLLGLAVMAIMSQSDNNVVSKGSSLVSSDVVSKSKVVPQQPVSSAPSESSSGLGGVFTWLLWFALLAPIPFVVYQMFGWRKAKFVAAAIGGGFFAVMVSRAMSKSLSAASNVTDTSQAMSTAFSTPFAAIAEWMDLIVLLIVIGFILGIFVKLSDLFK